MIKKTFNLLVVMILGFGLFSPVTAETLKISYDADPVTLDPHEQLSGGMLQFSHMVFDPLVRWDRSMGFEPRLAESWERVNETTMRFTLRKGVLFHSGNKLTSKDVKFTFDRIKESPDFKAIFTQFETVNIIDDHTFDIVTKGPFPLVLNNATYIFPMDSQFYSGKDAGGNDKSQIIKHGDSFASTNVSGTGPYTVSSREQGVRVEFDRNSNYWDKDSVSNLTKVVLTPIKEAPTRVAALLAGDVDFIMPVPPTDHGRINDSKKVDLVTMSGTRIITLQMNQERVEAFKDVRVRQAIAYAINQEGIVKKIMKGFATPAAQMSPEGYLGHNTVLKPRYDLNKAKQLMKEAGYEKGLSVTMMAPNNRYVNDEKIAQAAVSMLAKIGIKVDLKTMPKAQYWPEFDKRSADIMMIGWHSDTEDSNNFYEFLTACPDKESGLGQYNSGNYCNKAADELMAQANTEVDPAKRSAIMQKIEQMLFDDAAYVPLHWQDLAWGVAAGSDITEVINKMNFPYFDKFVIKR